jgi:glutathione peroxidase
MRYEFFKKIFMVFLFLSALSCQAEDKGVEDMSIYDFKVKNIAGKEVSLSDYKGKTILIVNTASKCGFTPQFEGLQKLYDTYKEKDFVILGFPCNQFLSQDPGSNDDIQQFCSINYGVTFPMFAKIKVNGKDAHPLYKFLKSQKKTGISSRIKWNFTKFLVDKDGNVIARFAPSYEPEKIASEIEKLLD